MLTGFAPRRDEFPIESAKAMLVHATDTNDRWHVTLAPDGINTVRDGGPADGALTGDASDLYLALWNRTEDANITVSGDQELLNKWHDNVRVRWS